MAKCPECSTTMGTKGIEGFWETNYRCENGHDFSVMGSGARRLAIFGVCTLVLGPLAGAVGGGIIDSIVDAVSA